MKKFLFALLFPLLAQATPYEIRMLQRDPSDVAFIARDIANPASSADGVYGYNGTTQLPTMFTLGSTCAMTSGTLNCGVQANWNSVSGPSQILNRPSLATVALTGDWADIINKPTTFTPAAHNQAWTTITSTPTTLSGYGITDATSSARNAVSLTTSGTSGAGTYNPSTGVLNIPNYTTGSGTVTSVTLSSSNLTVAGTNPITTSGTITVNLPSVVTAGTCSSVVVDAQGRVTTCNTLSINDSPGRSLVTTTSSTGYQISSTRVADVCYEGAFQTTSTIGGPAAVTVFLETADTNSTTPGDWTTKAQQTNSNTITLAVALNQVDTEPWSLCRKIPAGKFVRLRSGSITGTAAATINTQQQENLL